MRLADLILTIPALALAAALARSGSGTLLLIGLVLAAVSAPYVARVVRGVVLSLREREFVEAARALGASNIRIMFRHLMPNTLAVLIVNATLLVAAGILLETALSFVGFGIQSPDTSLGLLITTGRARSTPGRGCSTSPGLFIILIALTVNFIGDGLRDALDPRQTREQTMTIDLEVDTDRATRRRRHRTATDALLVVDNLTVTFPTDDGVVNAVRGVSATRCVPARRWASSASPARASR